MIQWCFLNLRVFGRKISMLQFICVHNSQCYTICFHYLFQICFKYIALFGNDSPPDFAHRLPAEEAAEPRRCSPTQPCDTTTWNNDNNDNNDVPTFHQSIEHSPPRNTKRTRCWMAKCEFLGCKKNACFFVVFWGWLLCSINLCTVCNIFCDWIRSFTAAKKIPNPSWIRYGLALSQDCLSWSQLCSFCSQLLGLRASLTLLWAQLLIWNGLKRSQTINFNWRSVENQP